LWTTTAVLATVINGTTKKQSCTINQNWRKIDMKILGFADMTNLAIAVQTVMKEKSVVQKTGGTQTAQEVQIDLLNAVLVLRAIVLQNAL
jgi:alpha-D-ribose 1-methylphosphonate 5-triphosphate synthase subunit PhnI